MWALNAVCRHGKGAFLGELSRVGRGTTYLARSAKHGTEQKYHFEGFAESGDCITGILEKWVRHILGSDVSKEVISGDNHVCR